MTAEKIKIKADEHTLQLLQITLDSLRRQGGIPFGLELEGLVLLDWQQRNLVKLAISEPPVKITFKPHEAVSLRRILFGVGMLPGLGAIVRDDLCAMIEAEIGIQ